MSMELAIPASSRMVVGSMGMGLQLTLMVSSRQHLRTLDVQHYVCQNFPNCVPTNPKSKKPMTPSKRLLPMAEFASHDAQALHAVGSRLDHQAVPVAVCAGLHAWSNLHHLQLCMANKVVEKSWIVSRDSK